MRLALLPIPLLLALSTALTLPKPLPPLSALSTRDTGPISIQTPAEGWPAEQSVTFNSNADGLPSNLGDPATTCLTDYSIGRFYDGWDGNECGEMGWFKGSGNDKIGAVECYQVCATYLLYMGIQRGSTDFQCDYKKGMHGHCWMGYHPLQTGPGVIQGGAGGNGSVATS